MLASSQVRPQEGGGGGENGLSHLVGTDTRTTLAGISRRRDKEGEAEGEAEMEDGHDMTSTCHAMPPR